MFWQASLACWLLPSAQTCVAHADAGVVPQGWPSSPQSLTASWCALQWTGGAYDVCTWWRLVAAQQGTDVSAVVCKLGAGALLTGSRCVAPLPCPVAIGCWAKRDWPCCKVC